MVKCIFDKNDISVRFPKELIDINFIFINFNKVDWVI